MSVHYLHFTLGPVQAFVAQARRTRDFWAGSFLLSWLAAIAMKEVEAQGGEVVFPQPNDDFIRALTGANVEEAPKQGNVPNRFKARFDTMEEAALHSAKAIESAVQKAWQALSEHVYDKDLAVHSHIPTETYTLWDQQVASFWEINWALSSDANDVKALERRKYWRNYLPPEQEGVKCMMMDGWQELSGLPEKGQRYPSQRELNSFWGPIREATTMSTDLREGEMLCAVGFIKRRFVRHFKDFECDMNTWVLKGWALSPNVPSVAYMAGVHWLESVLDQNECSGDDGVSVKAKRFLEEARRLSGLPEMKTRIRCLENKNLSSSATAIDGNMFHPAALENSNIYPDQRKASLVLSSLLVLKKAMGAPLASPFYAVLMMDGDAIGELLQSFKGDNGEGEQKLSKALQIFTANVDHTVYQHNGFLIYAGGDDVLAILPLEDALVCAAQLRMDYLDAFKEAGLPDTSTLSGAIQYAHIKVPLNKLLKDAHNLLDTVAKAKTGRDAIAIRVQRSAGASLEWSMPWQKALLLAPRKVESTEGKEKVLLTVIESLAYDLSQYDQQEGQFSNRLLFKIDEFFAQLGSGEGWEENDILGLLFMAYRNSGSSRKLTETLSEDDLKPLLVQSQIWRTGEQQPVQKFPTMDAALLIRFLAQKGAE